MEERNALMSGRRKEKKRGFNFFLNKKRMVVIIIIIIKIIMKTCEVQIQSKTVLSAVQLYITFRQRTNKKRYTYNQY